MIPLPAYPAPCRTLERRKDAISISYSGRWEEAVDLYRGTVEEDGFFCGILDTMAHGLLGLPLEFQGGSDEMRLALLDAGGTPGDYGAMHPQEECAKIVRDGLGLGLGLGQYVLMCWRCGYTDHERVQLDACSDNTTERCKRCRAYRIGRPYGMRQLFQMQWRDPRWLYQNPVTFQWFYNGRSAMVPIIDGDGEWFMYRTVPGLEPWRHGPWIWATLASVFSRDAQYDAQNTSSVCAPTPVLRAVKPTTDNARRDARAQVESLAFNNKLVLSGEWVYEIVAASADFQDICETIVNRCSDAFETGLTGNVMGRAARSAFTDASIYRRTTSERRAFYGNSWTRQVREKGLVWWGLDNYGTRNVPMGAYDVRSPEDKLAESKAIAEEAAAIGAAVEQYAKAGVELDPEWIVERAQRKGIRIQVKALATPAGAVPATAGAGAPPAPSDDDEVEQDDGEAARLADEMTQHQIDACEHGKRNRCRLCGVERVRGVVPGQDGAPHGWRLAWRAIQQGEAT